jgi:hypothetical protein
MTPQFEIFVAEAAAVKTEGRWRELNERVTWVAAHPFKGMEWHGELFGSLCYQVFSEYHRLTQTYERSEARDAAALAWSARNLLELSVWYQCFTSSVETARQLYEDAERDAHDLLKAFERWGRESDFPPDWYEPITAERERLKRRTGRRKPAAAWTATAAPSSPMPSSPP